MYLGKIVEIGPGDALYGVPAPPLHGRAAVGGAGRRPVAARAPSGRLLGGDVPSPANPPSGVPLPHALPEGAGAAARSRSRCCEDKGTGTRRGLPLPADPRGARGDRRTISRDERRSPTARGGEAEELLQRLIRFNTVNPPGNERAGAGVPRRPPDRRPASSASCSAPSPSAPTWSRGCARRPAPTRADALLPRARRHGARRPGRVDARPVVGRPRRRLPVGARRARHEVAGRRRDRRRGVARALGLAPGARRAADRGGRRRGDRRRAGRAVDHRDAPREGALRPARQRGRRRRVRVRRQAPLRRVLRREGRVPLHVQHRRASPATPRCRGWARTRC